MKIITTIELVDRDQHELAALFGQLSARLVSTEKGSAERRNTLASLENISRAIGFGYQPAG